MSRAGRTELRTKLRIRFYPIVSFDAPDAWATKTGEFVSDLVESTLDLLDAEGFTAPSPKMSEIGMNVLEEDAILRFLLSKRPDVLEELGVGKDFCSECDCRTEKGERGRHMSFDAEVDSSDRLLLCKHYQHGSRPVVFGHSWRKE